MKLNELLEANINFCSPLEVRSAFNGRVLCKNFDRKKHIEIGERELVSLWASTKKRGDDPGSWIYPMLCCYVDGRPEYEKEAVDGETNRC